MLTTLDVSVTRKVSAADLRWPAPGEASGESCLGCNRTYADFRYCSWAAAKRTVKYEALLLHEIQSATDPLAILEDDDREAEIFENLGCLDLGVASTVIALSAAKCIPFTSCNGGILGGAHLEAYPLVAFFAKPPQVPLLLAAAEEAGTGLENSSGDAIVVYTGDLPKMLAFASALVDQRRAFDGLKRYRRPDRHFLTTAYKQDQLPLPLAP